VSCSSHCVSAIVPVVPAVVLLVNMFGVGIDPRNHGLPSIFQVEIILLVGFVVRISTKYDLVKRDLGCENRV
jgi:hypothetical protein